MKYLAILVLLLASTCCAQTLTISDQLPPPVKYPAEVYTMTDAEFFQWATDYNVEQLKAWKQKKSAIKEPEFIYGEESTTTGKESDNFSDRGDDYYDRPCAGRQGFGNYWERYDHSLLGSGNYYDRSSRDSGNYYDRSSRDSGNYYDRYDRAPRGRYDGSYSQSTVTLQRRWPNPWYVLPGPMNIVNPYCRPSR